MSLAAPASAKPAPEALASQVDQIFAEFGPSSPGCVLGVIRDGGIIYSKGFGLASLEHGVPLTPRTVLDIGSISKQFTAASILLLAQDGKLSLDDNVRKFIPELPDYGTPITLRHLLHHTSGLRDYIFLLTLGGINFEDVASQEESLAFIVRQKELDFRPGEEYSYNNSGYFLLSVIVKRASGKSLREFAQERIFDPLGMTSTQYLDNHKLVIPRRASSYFPGEDGGFLLETSDWEQNGDGGVLTTLEDLAKWDRNFYEPKVGGPALIEQLETRGALNNGEEIDYARGLHVGEYRGLRRVSHGGGWAGFVSDMIRFPEERFSVITLCNVGTVPTHELSLKVADLYLADRLQPASPEPAAASEASAAVDLSRYPGLFFEPKMNQVRRIYLKEGKLFYEREPGNESELAPLGPDRFVMVDSPLYSEVLFSTSPEGRREMRLPFALGRPLSFQAVEPVSLSAEDLAGFAGTFFSEELGITYTLSVKDGALVLQKANRFPGEILQPAFADAFKTRFEMFRFTRDSGKKVTGFTVNSSRVRNIGFTRVSKSI